MKKAMIAAMLLGACQMAQADMFITELMYNGNDSEFIEFTNTGPAAIDLTGWSYDDNSRTPGSLDLSPLGIVQPGESVIVSEVPAADFRTAWGLSAAVKVLGENAQNLGRSDEVNLYNASSQLVDRLTYNDQGTGNVDGPRAQNISANPPNSAALGTNNYSTWILSNIGDAFGSWSGVNGDVANPGRCTVPEPATLAFLLMGSLVMGYRRR